jgi:asparagine synthase (glutamine-hydrolysing)
MCGFAAVVRRSDRPITPAMLRCMAGALRHRGPDGCGYYQGARCGLAHVRLSVIDIDGGAQPLGNEDGRILAVYNGEVFNYRELRRELESHGHRFRTRSDTEVLVHGYEEWGRAMLHRLNGQFAFALYDRRRESLLVARDRFGICPLFYAQRQGDLYVASEAKALFASGEVTPEPDLHGLDQVFTFWGARAPRTVFRDVHSLEPGAFAEWRNGTLTLGRYYELSYRESRDEPANAVETLDRLMHDVVAVRLRADVPVGGYLSGGIDSSITCALAAELSPHQLRTFSVTFDDPALDESRYQRLAAARLSSRHAVQSIRQHEIADVFPEVVRHAETPMLRTAPAPLFLLARLAREHGIKVVLTGEGSDELFLGYDLFKETVVRRFCLRQPSSRMRPRLFDRLYPYLEAKGRSGELWRKSFLLPDTSADPLFSHLPRYHLASWAKIFYSGEMRAAIAGTDALDTLREGLPPAFSRWSDLNRAAYLEMTTLLSSYLLSTQGERMAMAHGVEARYPFLDHRLFEFAATLPARSKLCGLHEKEILRRWAQGRVPSAVLQRPKQPYRAPDIPAFFADEPAYVAELLDAPALERVGLFDPVAVRGLVGRCRNGRATSVRESQALVGMLSTQLWHAEFFTRPMAVRVPRQADVALADAPVDAADTLIPLEAQ